MEDANNPTEVSHVGIDGWEKGSGWGWIWGDDDEIGALNALGPGEVLDALSLVKEGKTYDLGVVVDNQSYKSPFHVDTEVVPYCTPDGLINEEGSGFDDPGGVSANTSMIIISDHMGTQIDGLCHTTFGEDQHWYNGFTYDEWGRDDGPAKAGAHQIPPIITRGVLVDIPEDKGRDSLQPETAVDPDDLKSALNSQEITLQPGDAVFIRTGVMRYWGKVGANHDRIAEPDSAGLTLDAAKWLVEEMGAVLIGADNSTVEVTPPVDGDSTSPVHRYLLVEQGVHMGEFHYLEELSADGIYEFCYIALTPKVRATTGGFALQPIALV